MLAAQAKIFASEAAIRIVNDSLQMFGARGYSRDLPLERMARDVRMFTIGGGTAQVLRTLVASRMLGWKLPQTRDGYVEDRRGRSPPSEPSSGDLSAAAPGLPQSEYARRPSAAIAFGVMRSISAMMAGSADGGCAAISAGGADRAGRQRCDKLAGIRQPATRPARSRADALGEAGALQGHPDSAAAG